MASALKEVLGAHNGLLFKEEALSPVFCKPKLIPLKSVTLEKLEQMQRDSMAKILELEQKLKEDAKVVGVLLIALIYSLRHKRFQQFILDSFLQKIECREGIYFKSFVRLIEYLILGYHWHSLPSFFNMTNLQQSSTL